MTPFTVYLLSSFHLLVPIKYQFFPFCPNLILLLTLVPSLFHVSIIDPTIKLVPSRAGHQSGVGPNQLNRPNPRMAFCGPIPTNGLSVWASGG